MKKRYVWIVICAVIIVFVILFRLYILKTGENLSAGGTTYALYFVGNVKDMDEFDKTATITLYPEETIREYKQFSHMNNTQEEEVLIRLTEDQMREIYIGADIEFSFLNDHMSEEPFLVDEIIVFQIPLKDMNRGYD